MPEKSSEDMLKVVKETLDDIKAILLLANQDKLAAMKKNLIKTGSIEEQIYELCNGENSSEDISKVINKPNEYTRAVVSTLRRKGLIKTVQKSGKKVHEQIF